MANFSGMTDEQLVKAYASGCNEAFDVLLKSHQDRIFNYILRIIKNEDIANDIFQETFVKAIQTIRQGRYTENGKFLSSTITVRRNQKIFRVQISKMWIFSTERNYARIR